MEIFVIFLLLCFLIFALVYEMFQYYVNEFHLDKAEPVTIDMIKKIISLIVETKICSKFEKPVPPTPQYIEFYSKKAIYFILACLLSGFLGYVTGIRKHKTLIFPLPQNINENSSINSDYEPPTCSLCLNVFKPRMILLPCKHVCICTDCWNRFLEESQHSCPICRKTIEGVMDVYLS